MLESVYRQLHPRKIAPALTLTLTLTKPLTIIGGQLSSGEIVRTREVVRTPLESH